MARHKLRRGIQVIDDLKKLAESLEYDCEDEYIVGRTGAAVDLAWFGAGDQRVPLMIFEIESRASSSMANNALKIFSQDVEDFVKPLFFFHLLLGGGRDNERIAAMRKTWGTYNYRVYRLNSKLENQRLVSDILGQHRRVNEKISFLHLDAALRSPSWSDVSVVEIFETAEHLQFAGNYLRDLACLAAGNPLFQPLFATRLREWHVDGKAYPGDYDTYLGSHYAPILEICLLVGNGTVADNEGVRLLAEWQRGPYGLSMIGPHFGLSREYDRFVLCCAPFVFAVAATLCRKKLLAKAWIVHQLSELIDGEQNAGVRSDYITAARIWLLHIAASAVRDFSTRPPSWEEADLVEIYNRARAAVSMTKVPMDLLFAPPSASELMRLEEDQESLPIGELSSKGPFVDFPEWTNVSDGYFPEIEQHDWSHDKLEVPWRDAFELTVAALTSDAWASWPTSDIVRLLHAAPFLGEDSPPG
jgi:hypothetical protein